MPRLITTPTVIHGVEPKRIEEYAGRLTTQTEGVSVARMVAPHGWTEPGQRPEFDEVTLVLEGSVRIEHDDGVIDVAAGQAVLANAGEWVRYSTPHDGGAVYIAVCTPAFHPDTVHRDDEG